MFQNSAISRSISASSSLLALAGSYRRSGGGDPLDATAGHAVLFANLAVDDASGIIDKLKDAKVPYETTNGGTTILVPNAQVHDLRLEMAGQGLPHGGESDMKSSIGPPWECPISCRS